MQQTHCPTHTDSVRQNGIELVEQPPIVWISPRHGDRSRIDECEQGGLPRLAECVEKEGRGLGVGDRINANSQGLGTNDTHSAHSIDIQTTEGLLP